MATSPISAGTGVSAYPTGPASAAAPQTEIPSKEKTRYSVKDLKADLVPGTTMYRLTNGEKYPVTDEESLSSDEILLEHTDGLIFLTDEDELENATFPCSHNFLQTHWQHPTDYDFVFAEGFNILFNTKTVVLIQRGMLRFGCPQGFALKTLRPFISSLEPTQSLDVLCQPDHPGEKPMQHVAYYGPDILSKIDVPKIKICPSEVNVSMIPQDQIEAIQQAVREIDPSIHQKAELQKTRPYICKKCNGYKNINNLTELNEARKGGLPVFSCPGCDSRLISERGCSMITCLAKEKLDEFCLIPTQTCIYCLNGSSTELSHDLAQCSEKLNICREKTLPLPAIKVCTCSDHPKESPAASASANDVHQ